MTSVEGSDPYISPLQLSERYPQIFGRPSAPQNKGIMQPVKMNLNMGRKDIEHRQSRFLLGLSPLNKKRVFSETGKNTKSDIPQTLDSKLDEEFNIMRKGVIPVQKFFNKLRRKNFYKSIERLTNNHYHLIGDMAAHPLDKGTPIIKSNNRKRVKDFWGYLTSVLVNKMKLETLLNRLSHFVKNAEEKIPTFNTNTHLGIAWSLIVLILCVAQIFVYSIEKCFGTSLETNKLGYTVVLIVWLDLVVKLNTRFFIDGEQILDRKKILTHIAKNNFFTDIVPCFCLTSILFSNESIDFYDINLILLFKIPSALDIGEKISDLFIKGDKSQSIYDLIILILTILSWAHLIACLWHYIGYSSNLSNPEGSNWLKLRGIVNETWSVRYLFSVYWGVTTMLTVGYGDISPSNDTEIFFNIWAMVLGCGMFGYSMNRIGEILSFASGSKRRRRKRMKKVLKMMREKEVPQETQIKVRKYLEFLWKQEKREDPQHEKEIIEKLSTKLREEILLSTNVKFLKKVEAFKSFSDKALLSLANFMRKVRFSPKEIVYKEKDIEDISVFFVIDGTLESVIMTDKNIPTVNSIKSVYKKYDYFGVQEVFSGRPRVSGIESLDFSTVFKLNRNDILYILQKFPEEYERFCKLRDMDIIYDNQNVYSIKCESCGFEDHRINECRFLRYLPPKLPLISKYINRKQKNRRNFKRKPRKKENCLLKIELCREFIEEFLLNYKEDPEVLQLHKYYENIYEKMDSEPDIDDNKEPSNDNLVDQSLEKIDENSEETVQLSGDRFGIQGKSKSRTFSSQRFKTGSLKSFYSSVGFKTIEKNPTLSICEKREKSHELKSLTSNPTMKTGLRELVFDKVRSYKYYFPWNNVEQVTKKSNFLNKIRSISPKNLIHGY